MASFTENALVLKLQELTSSQQSIQTLSLWLVHHRRHFAVVVKTWFKEIIKANDSKQLTFIYLANDVIQNSKKEGPEYGKEFGKVLVESFKHMAKTGINTKIKCFLHMILTSWEKIGVYDSQEIQEFKEAVDSNDGFLKKVSKRKAEDAEASMEPGFSGKKAKIEAPAKPSTCCRCGEPANMDRRVETHKIPFAYPPEFEDSTEPEELIRALLELDAIASTDEAIRERIASVPPDVAHKVQLLSKMPPYHRINFIISLVKRLIYLNNLRNIRKVFIPKITGDK